MAKNENEKILSCRNRTSMCLDDLVAQVNNSTLANELRIFSDDVMKLKPGFAFDMKQARELKTATELALKQYIGGAGRDDDLIRYMADARTILQGKNIMNGGRQMGILDKVKQVADKVLRGNEIKKQQSIDAMEKLYKETCEQILASEKEMERCIRESRGASPDSMIYRNNERAYMNARNKIVMLRKQEGEIRKILDAADRRRMIETYNNVLKMAEKNADILIGDEASFSKMIAEAEVRGESLAKSIESTEMLGAGLFEEGEESPKASNAFDEAMAEDERRRAMMMSAGISESDTDARETTLKPEFPDAAGNNDP